MHYPSNRLLSHRSVKTTYRCMNVRLLSVHSNDFKVTHQLYEFPSEFRRKIIGPKVDKIKCCCVCQPRALASFTAQGAHRQVQFFPCVDQAHVDPISKLHP